MCPLFNDPVISHKSHGIMVELFVIKVSYIITHSPFGLIVMFISTLFWRVTLRCFDVWTIYL